MLEFLKVYKYLITLYIERGNLRTLIKTAENF